MPAKIVSCSIQNFLNQSDSLREECFLRNRWGQGGHRGTTEFFPLMQNVFLLWMLSFIREHLVQTSKAALGFLYWSICSGRSCHSPSLHLVLSFMLLPAPYLFFLCWKQVGCEKNPSFSLSHLCGCVVWGTVWTSLESLAFIQLCCHLSISFSVSLTDDLPLYMWSLFSLPNVGLLRCHIQSDYTSWLHSFLITSFPCEQLHHYLDFLSGFFFWPSQTLSTSLAFCKQRSQS